MGQTEVFKSEEHQVTWGAYPNPGAWCPPQAFLEKGPEATFNELPR